MSDINYNEEVDKIEKLLNDALQRLADPKYKGAVEKYEFLNKNLKHLYITIDKFKKGKLTDKKKPVSPERGYKYIVNNYNKNIKDKLEETIDKETYDPMKIILNKIKGLLPPIENEQPKPEQPQTEPEQQEPEQQVPEQQEPVPTNPTFPKGKALNENISRLNPDAPPISVVSPTPIDDSISKPDPEEEGEQDSEESEQEPGQANQVVPNNNHKQIVQSKKKNYKIADKEIDEFKNNPELDIIAGVGEIIEFMATSDLTEEDKDKLVDKILTMKDSHGNPLFDNRFQIEDFIRDRKKRRRLKYLLPKRIINAEKPDEQKLIINPMLRRGRIASMTSAKERYYNYI